MTTKKLIQRIKSEREHISDQAKDLGLIFNVNVTDEMTDTLVEMVNRINSRESAEGVLERLDSVMDKVNANRANMGAVINRLTHAIDNLSNVSMNTTASKGRIVDADFAQESARLSKSQILQQSAMNMVAQASRTMQNVLVLFQ